MQTQFNIHEAKSHLSRLIEQVEAGGEAVIARAGKPVVRLVLARTRGLARPHSPLLCKNPFGALSLRLCDPAT